MRGTWSSFCLQSASRFATSFYCYTYLCTYITPICVHFFQIFSKKDGKGTPPLVTAVNTGNLEICRYLLENGAKIDATDRRLKRSALQYAILAKNLDIFDLLLK